MPGQETRLAPPCSNLRSYGSKCNVLEKILAILLGLFSALQWFGSRSIVHPCPTSLGQGTRLNPALFDTKLLLFAERWEKSLKIQRENVLNDLVYCTPVFSACLNAYAAFERTNHSLLFKQLLKCNVPTCKVKLLLKWYRNPTIHVKWGTCSQTTSL